MTCPNRNEALDQRLQITAFREPDIRGLFFHFVSAALATANSDFTGKGELWVRK